MAREGRDCDALGLTDAQRAALTGFSGWAIRALAHLREAWCVADPENRVGVEAAIRALVRTHSLQEIPRSCAAVLAYRLDDGLAAALLDAVGLREWR